MGRFACHLEFVEPQAMVDLGYVVGLCAMSSYSPWGSILLRFNTVSQSCVCLMRKVLRRKDEHASAYTTSRRSGSQGNTRDALRQPRLDVNVLTYLKL